MPNQPPFMPVTFRPGPPTTPVWEDGPGAFVNPSNSGTPVYYAGMRQQQVINIANPLPPFCTLPGAAIGLSKIP